mmetsp:Transcript_53371/g.121659  ORF Transcript_53371/g.121659 Transcript_53371/m.121659 type:complete len:203 (-) Transcript_53371:685-1293(-)
MGWAEDFLDWVEGIDVPPMTRLQKALLYSVLFVIVVVATTSLTGHFNAIAMVLASFFDELTFTVLTTTVVVTLVLLTLIGVNTTLLALVAGYIYSRRTHSTLEATVVGSAVSFCAICLGCIAAYGFSRKVFQSWSTELRRRNPVLGAMDQVLFKQGLKVNILLRLTMPDSLINMSVNTKRRNSVVCSQPECLLSPCYVLQML